MDYCDCGEQADGRCVSDGAFVCRKHRRRYPGPVVYWLDRTAAGPLRLQRHSDAPLRVTGHADVDGLLLCPACAQRVLDEAVPVMAAHLRESEGGSAERATVRYLTQTTWQDSGLHAALVGPRVVTAVAGRRPDWLADGEASTLVALYTNTARAQGLAPPRLAVRNATVQHRRSLLGGLRSKPVVIPLGEVAAWQFPYRDDEGRECLLLLGATGAAADVSTAWLPVDGVVTLKGPAEVRRQDFAGVQRQLKAARWTGHDFVGWRSTLFAALRQLYGM